MQELGYAVFAGAASSFVCICLVIASFALGKDLSGLHNPLSIGMVRRPPLGYPPNCHSNVAHGAVCPLSS